MTKLRVSLLCAALLAAGARTGAAHPGHAAPKTTRTVRWTVAHFRDDASFNKLLDGFARRVAEKSGGMLKVEFDNPAGPEAGRELDSETVNRRLTEGSADMAQVEVVALGAGVIETPFLFRGYEHAESVWNSPVGDKLLARIPDATGGKVEGLAFSYSGGYRIMVGQKAVRRASDFKNLRLRDNGTSAEIFADLGAATVKVERAELAGKTPLDLAAEGRVDLEETEINRLAYFKLRHPDAAKKLKYLNLTNNSMLVTVMAANRAFLASLDEKSRALLVQEVRALPAAERKLSVDLARTNLESLRKDGMTVVSLPKSEQRAMETLAETHSAKSPDAATIREIKAVKDVEVTAASLGSAADRP